MPLSVDEFRKYLKINKEKLDDELVQHSQLFFAVCEELVNALALRDGAKEGLAVTDAELDAKYRIALEKRHDKVTEAMVKGRVQTDPEHERVFGKFVEAKKRADLLQALKDSFEQRGHMVRDLCKLYIASYYDEGSVKGTNRIDKDRYEVRREALARQRTRSS